MSKEESHVEIGYLEKTEPFKLESRFFPSKVGGKPAWLDLKEISVDVNCGVCKTPCVFLCQVYAPIDNQSNAFHRTIFVFVCRNPDCCSANNNDNFIVLRCQLPQQNKYYPAEEPDDTLDWHPESKIERFNSTCVVCGCLGSFQCGKCRTTKYCSKAHQSLDWKSGHNTTCGTGQESKSTNVLFPEFEIIIEPETIDDEEGDKMEEKTEEEKLKEYERLLQEGKAGTLCDVADSVLEQFVQTKEDKYLKKFKSLLALDPDQVIRYDRGGNPLWIGKPNLGPEGVPKCEICQSSRQFEFQILSTLLNHLNVDSLEKSIDWGTLLIYTCKNNCGEGPAYKREFLWKQDIL